MHWRNDSNRWGWIAILFHWLTALTVVVMFAMGLWMVDLDFYSVWYHQAPALHKSIGITLFVVTVLRLGWRWASDTPLPLKSHQWWERRAAHGVHLLLYLLLFGVMFSGYLISTADGRAVEPFGLFSLPATITSIPEQEDIAGEIHLFLASVLIGLALMHAAAAIKHHFIDRDSTLTRMLPFIKPPTR